MAGDLDNVVLMALRKELERCCASVGLLSEDLRRYREGLPVRGRQATFGERMAKFVGRHRLAARFAGRVYLLVLVLVLGLAVAMALRAFGLARQADEICR